MHIFIIITLIENIQSLTYQFVPLIVLILNGNQLRGIHKRLRLLLLFRLPTTNGRVISWGAHNSFLLSDHIAYRSSPFSYFCWILFLSCRLNWREIIWNSNWTILVLNSLLASSFIYTLFILCNRLWLIILLSN